MRVVESCPLLFFSSSPAYAYLVDLLDGTVESCRFSIQALAGIEGVWKNQAAAEPAETVAMLAIFCLS